MFLDERVEPLEAHSRFIVSCVVCERSRWDGRPTEASRIGALGARRRLDEIDRFLQSLPGVAVIGHATVSDHVAIPGEVDRSLDIPRMHRLNNLWSSLFLGVVTRSLAGLSGAGATDADIEVFYDRRDVTRAHRDAMRRVLEMNLPTMAAENPATGQPDPSRGTVHFIRFEEVAERGAGETPSVLQHGTSIAHHLCSQAGAAISGRTRSAVEAVDLTDAILEMIGPYRSPDGAQDGAA